MPTGIGPGTRRELRRHAERRGRIAPGQRFERAQRLLVGEVEVAHAVAEGRQGRVRERQLVLVAPADAQAVLHEGELALGSARPSPRRSPFCRRASVARNQLLATSAASDWRAYSASSAAESYWSCAAARPARTRPPEVDLPVGEYPGALEAARVAAQRAAAARKRVDLRIQRRAGDLDERRGLLDAHRRDLQVGIVGERLLHQRIELRVLEAGEPLVGNRARGAALRVHAAGTWRFGSACFAISSRSGGAFSAQPAKAARRCTRSRAGAPSPWLSEA